MPAAATWLAVATTDHAALVRALGLRTELPANWAGGFAEAQAGGVFVTPAVARHCLVVGAGVDALDLDGEVLPLLAALSRSFGRAAWFRRDDQGERHGWAVAEAGRIVRAYAWDGTVGHVAWDGEVSADERELGCFVDDPRDHSDDEQKWWPDARLVDALAARWSIDPKALAGHATGTCLGTCGRLPPSP
ncbi:MAG: hypothetical protein WAT39_07705 [Planctomycetota bacterium]